MRAASTASSRNSSSLAHGTFQRSYDVQSIATKMIPYGQPEELSCPLLRATCRTLPQQGCLRNYANVAGSKGQPPLDLVCCTGSIQDEGVGSHPVIPAEAHGINK